MTNFEPKKLPPLGPPGGRKPPAKPNLNPPSGVPAAPNLPPRLNSPPPSFAKPASPQLPTVPPPATFPPAVNQPQEPIEQSQYEPQQQQFSQPSWEQQQQQQQQHNERTQNNYGEQQSESWGRDTHRNEQQSGWGRENSQQDRETRGPSEETEKVDNSPKGKRAAKKAAIEKAKKDKKPAKGKKVNQYAGSRSKLLLTRITLFGTIGILVAAGIYSFVPKSSYLTVADQNVIINKVRENLGQTYFPADAGEGWARGFLDVYLNYTPETSEERKKQLLTFTTEEVLKDIDISFLTVEEVDSLSNRKEATVEDLEAATGIIDSKLQVITAGPYLIKQELLPGGDSAIFSYRVQINGNKWAYIEVPIYYNVDKRGLSISGTPTFRSVIPISSPPEADRKVTFENDREVSKKIKDDIKAYMQAWVSSDQTGIDRYLVKEGGANAVTPQASTGLGGSVQFLSMDKMTVQSKVLPPEDELTAEAKAEFNKRFVVVSIRVVEPTSGIVYRQNYQLVIQYINENWFVQDIRSMVVFAEDETK